MLLDALAALVPVPCAGCGEEGRLLCAACRGALALRPVAEPVPGVGVVHAGLAYDGVARAAILALKERGASGLAAPLAVPFAAAVTTALAASPPVDAIVAVPSTWAARRRRGFEPVRLLAARSGIRLSRVFAPARPHGAQKALGIAERGRNLAGAFALEQSVAGRRVLLVDDVLTTGATLAAAAAVLRAGGAEVAAAAVLAATARRDGRVRGMLSKTP